MSNYTDFAGGTAPKAWVSGKTYTVGKVVLSTVDFCYYVRKVAGAGTTDPSSDTTNWQNTNGIKSIQRGIYTAGSGSSGTVTISSVNTAKTEVRHLGGMVMDGSATIMRSANISLTNSTTLTIAWYGAGAMTASWELTERY